MKEADAADESLLKLTHSTGEEEADVQKDNRYFFGIFYLYKKF